MYYYTFTPPEKLRDLVRFFWVFESDDDLTEPYVYRSMADSCCELIFHYKGRYHEITKNGTKTSSFFSGIHSQTQHYRRFVTDEPFGIFGAYLYPFATFRLLNLSPSELTNEMPSLTTALGRAGAELEEQMFLAPDNQNRSQILTDFLERQFSKYPSHSHPALSAVKFVIHSKKSYRVGQLAEHFNLSERQFERKFKEYSGFTPKKYMRLVRFSEACNQYEMADEKSLSEIGHFCGYYDQSHFIKEFKRFSGYHPSDFFSGNAEGIEWRESEG